MQIIRNNLLFLFILINSPYFILKIGIFGLKGLVRTSVLPVRHINVLEALAIFLVFDYLCGYNFLL